MSLFSLAAFKIVSVSLAITCLFVDLFGFTLNWASWKYGLFFNKFWEVLSFIVLQNFFFHFLSPLLLELLFMHMLVLLWCPTVPWGLTYFSLFYFSLSLDCIDFLICLQSLLILSSAILPFQSYCWALLVNFSFKFLSFATLEFPFESFYNSLY